MSSSLPYAAATDYDGAPVLVAPEIRRLDGEVREVSVPPVVPPVTHGSLADLPFENAEAGPADWVDASGRDGPAIRSSPRYGMQQGFRRALLEGSREAPFVSLLLYRPVVSTRRRGRRCSAGLVES